MKPTMHTGQLNTCRHQPVESPARGRRLGMAGSRSPARGRRLGMASTPPRQSRGAQGSAEDAVAACRTLTVDTRHPTGMSVSPSTSRRVSA